MSYQWHSLKHGDSDAKKIIWIAASTKRGKVKRKRRA